MFTGLYIKKKLTTLKRLRKEEKIMKYNKESKKIFYERELKAGFNFITHKKLTLGQRAYRHCFIEDKPFVPKESHFTFDNIEFYDKKKSFKTIQSEDPLNHFVPLTKEEEELDRSIILYNMFGKKVKDGDNVYQNRLNAEYNRQIALSIKLNNRLPTFSEKKKIYKNIFIDNDDFSYKPMKRVERKDFDGFEFRKI